MIDMAYIEADSILSGNVIKKKFKKQCRLVLNGLYIISEGNV